MEQPESCKQVDKEGEDKKGPIEKDQELSICVEEESGKQTNCDSHSDTKEETCAENEEEEQPETSNKVETAIENEKESKEKESEEGENFNGGEIEIKDKE